MKKLFKYRLGNANECSYGDDDGFSIEIFQDGTVIYQEYEVPNIAVYKKEYRLSKRTINRLKVYILNCDCWSIPSNLDNGSCDGDFNEFWFYGENRMCHIHSWNIELFNEKDKSEKELALIFEKICKMLNRDGYKLTLYSFRKRILGIF